jgi:hypothetical protein
MEKLSRIKTRSRSSTPNTQQDYDGFIGGRQLQNGKNLLDASSGSVADLRISPVSSSTASLPKPVKFVTLRTGLDEYVDHP